MNKETYMSSLREALHGFEEDLVQEIVADYEERFRIGSAQGKTEEQIIRELGSVEDLVMELGELQGISQGTAGKAKRTSKEENTEESYTYRGTYTQDKSFSESLDSLMKKVGKVVDEAMREAGHALENAMEQVEIHVEEAKRRRAAGEDVNYNVDINFTTESEKESGKEPNVEQRGEGTEGCRKVVVDAGFADVEIRGTSKNVPTAECQYYSHKTAMAYPFFAYQEGDTFHVGIRQEYQEKKSGYFQFSWNPSIEIAIGIPEGVQYVTGTSGAGDITVDEMAAESLKLRSGSGDINVSYFTGTECFIESSSGDTTLEKSKVQSAELTTKSGDCTVSKLEVTRLVVGTMSGDVEADGIVGDKVQLRTMSGNQNVDDVEAKELNVSTASGDVDITDCRGTVLQASSASGNVNVSGDFSEYQANSQSGDVEVTSRHDANLNVHSTSGDVEIHVVEAEGHYEVTMHSVSGDCSVTGYQDAASAAPGEKIYHIAGKSISGDVTVDLR